MGELIAVVGNTGVGKTTLARLLSEKANYLACLEEHTERPFQAYFKQDRNYAFANQVDYLMLRAEQEHMIRSGRHIGIMDGGLEMDFHVFNRLFYSKGWLGDSQYTLLGRIYTHLRQYLSPPDLIIYLRAEPEIISRRYQRRGRKLEIATKSDIKLIAAYLRDWLDIVPRDKMITIDVSEEDPLYRSVLPSLIEQIPSLMNKVG